MQISQTVYSLTLGNPAKIHLWTT